MKTIKFNPKILKKCFDLKVREMCKSCKRYTFKATCPPYVENIEYYKKLFSTYHYGYLYYELFTKESLETDSELGKRSSKVIHDTLSIVRDNLFSQNRYFVNIYGAGSCKICETCSIPCRFPSKSIIPLEATGIDVVKLMKKFNIDISFPVKDSLYRIGMVLYD